MYNRASGRGGKFKRAVKFHQVTSWFFHSSVRYLIRWTVVASQPVFSVASTLWDCKETIFICSVRLRCH
jgi:hypothetical protein